MALYALDGSGTPQCRTKPRTFPYTRHGYCPLRYTHYFKPLDLHDGARSGRGGARPQKGGLDPDTGQGIASTHWHQGAAAVKVQVDEETGKFQIGKLHTSIYAGRVV